jgi:hypothetical protein
MSRAVASAQRLGMVVAPPPGQRPDRIELVLA